MIRSRARVWCGAVVLLLLASAPSQALILGGGREPMPDRDWPLGCEALANLPTRISWWEGPPFGGGEWHFQYRCQTTAEFNQALRAFAAVRAPQRELVLHKGPKHGAFMELAEGEQDTRIDWTFTVWNPARWYLLETMGNFGVLRRGRTPPAPTLDVYVGGGAITWEQVVVPEGLTVRDERAKAAPVKPAGGGLVRGDVFDMATGKPVADAEVTLRDMEGHERRVQGRTDAVGAFRIELIPPGRYQLELRAKGYASRRLEELYGNDANDYRQITVRLAPLVSLKGVVRDLKGNPICGAKMEAVRAFGLDAEEYPSPDSDEVWRAATSAVTDAEGRFTMGSLPMGYVEVACTVPGMHVASSNSEREEETFRTPGDTAALTLEGTGTIRGKVVGKGGQVQESVYLQPLALATGHMRGCSCQTKGDGSFEFPGLAPGLYLVSSVKWEDLEGLRVTAEIDKIMHPEGQRVTVEIGKTAEVTIMHGEP